MHKLDPVLFTVVLNGVFEWVTVEDCALLLDHFIRYDLPDDFWCKIYNIGSCEQYRLMNYEFEENILSPLGLPSITTFFEPHWFALRNSYGFFFADSEIPENYLHFRQNISVDQYFHLLAKQIEFYYKIPRYFPFKNFLGFFVHLFMKFFVRTKVFGTQDWIHKNNTQRITAYFGSKEKYEKIPKTWGKFKFEHYNTSSKEAYKYILNHGYDETKLTSELDLEDKVTIKKIYRINIFILHVLYVNFLNNR